MSVDGIRSQDGSRFLGDSTRLKWNDQMLLVAKTVRCSAIILPNVHFQKGDEEWIAPLQISSNGTEALTERSVVVVPPDNKDMVEFIFFNGDHTDCRHFQLDRQANPFEFSPTAKREISIDMDRLEGIKHLPWNRCVVIPHEGVLEPRKLQEGPASSRKLTQALASQKSVSFISSGSPAVDAVLSNFKTETPEYQRLQELKEAGNTEELINACRSYLDRLADKTVCCSAVVFSNARVRGRVSEWPSVEHLPIHIIHKSEKPLHTSGRLDVVPPDEGIVDFYLLDTSKTEVTHIQLDPTSTKQLEISANPRDFLDVDRRTVDAVKDIPWNGCVVVTEGMCFYPRSFTPLSVPRPDVSDVKG